MWIWDFLIKNATEIGVLAAIYTTLFGSSLIYVLRYIYQSKLKRAVAQSKETLENYNKALEGERDALKDELSKEKTRLNKKNTELSLKLQALQESLPDYILFNYSGEKLGRKLSDWYSQEHKDLGKAFIELTHYALSDRNITEKHIEDAERYLTLSLHLSADHSVETIAHIALLKSQLLVTSGRQDEALSAIDVVLEWMDNSTKENPDTLRKAGVELSKQGHYLLSYAFANRSLSISLKTLGPDHPHTLSSQYLVARILTYLAAMKMPYLWPKRFGRKEKPVQI